MFLWIFYIYSNSLRSNQPNWQPELNFTCSKDTVKQLNLLASVKMEEVLIFVFSFPELFVIKVSDDSYKVKASGI